MSAATRNFVRHYAEMLVAMLAGMVVLGGAAELAFAAAGTSTGAMHDDAPALMLLGMAFNMTVPMVAWMRHRGHGWAASNEMALSMFLPTFAVVGLLAGGAVTDLGTLMGIQHVVMLPSMLGAMLLRRDEYAGHQHHREAVAA